jgi:hypothetical protein
MWWRWSRFLRPLTGSIAGLFKSISTGFREKDRGKKSGSEGGLGVETCSDCSRTAETISRQLAEEEYSDVLLE